MRYVTPLSSGSGAGTSSGTGIQRGDGVGGFVAATADTDYAKPFTFPAVKTANYTAAADEFAVFDTTSGALTFTFPTAPANGTRVGGKIVAGTNVLNLALGGSDVFNVAGGSTTGSLAAGTKQALIAQYNAASAIWYVTSTDLPLSDLDTRYYKVGAAVALHDDKFTLQDNTDPTKQVVFELAGLTTGTTRTVTIPDSSFTIPTSGGGGGGDFSSNTTTSVDGEAVVFSGTAGKTGKRFAASGIVKATSGVLSAATSGTDYAPATSGTAILKASSGGFAAAVSGTDYAPATSGTAILKASAGGFANAVSGTDYAPATSGTSILKASSGGFANAVSGTDYAPATSGSAILKGNGAGGFSAAVSATDYAPATTGSSALKASSGGFATATINDLGAQTADYSANSHKFTNLLDPTGAQDAATKNYVDATIQGLQVKPTADVVATSALPAGTYSNGTSGVGATFTVTATGTTTIDGHVLAANELVLATAQASAFQNGLYVVTTAGASGIATVLTRHTDMDQAAEFSGAFVAVGSKGASNLNSLWLANPSGAVTVGTTSIPFTELNRATDLTQGTGISISGNTVSIENSGVLLPAHGGTGVATLTGLAKGNGTSAFTVATAGTDYVAPGGALGTPSSGTLTNCTFPTLNQSTTGSAATLTTARAINGVNFNGSAAITVPGMTLITSTASSATPSVTVTGNDQLDLTALAVALTGITVSGSPQAGWKLTVRVKDNGTARAFAPGTSFQSSDNAAIISTTVVGKTHIMGFIYDEVVSKYVLQAVNSY